MGATIALIISQLIPTIMKLVWMYLDKSKADADTMEKFFAFADKIVKDSTVTSALRQKYAKQKERTNAMIEEIEKNEGVRQ